MGEGINQKADPAGHRTRREYLIQVNINKFRQALTRLRLSSHRLQIETGRWHRPNSIPRNERKCQQCNILEDEFHFLLECPLYDNFRKQYIKQLYWRNPNILKFKSVLKTENTQEMRNLAVFVYKGFE